MTEATITASVQPEPSPLSMRTDSSKAEQRIQELILMTGSNETRRWRQTKAAYLKKVERDNHELKKLNVELQQEISALSAQRDILREQLNYFQACLVQASPLMFQQQTQ